MQAIALTIKLLCHLFDRHNFAWGDGQLERTNKRLFVTMQEQAYLQTSLFLYSLKHTAICAVPESLRYFVPVHLGRLQRLCTLGAWESALLLPNASAEGLLLTHTQNRNRVSHY